MGRLDDWQAFLVVLSFALFSVFLAANPAFELGWVDRTPDAWIAVSWAWAVGAATVLWGLPALSSAIDGEGEAA